MVRHFSILLIGLVSLGAMVAGGGEAWATELKCDFISGSGNYGGKWDSGYFHYDTTAKTIEVWQQSSNKQLPELQGAANRVLVQFQ